MTEAQQTPSTAVAKRELIPIVDIQPVFDTAGYDHIKRVASDLYKSTFLPRGLMVFRDNDSGFPVSFADAEKEPTKHFFDEIGTMANMIAIVVTARNLRMDPMAVAEATSIVHGRRMFEGKLVAAALDVVLGIELEYEFGTYKGDGDYDWTTEGKGDKLACRVTGFINAKARTIEGNVGDWKTTGTNSPWGKSANYKRQCRYRGARDWARAYKPAVMVGITTDDEEEVMQLEAERRSERLSGTGLASRLPPVKAGTGFRADGVRAVLDGKPVMLQNDGSATDPRTGEVVADTVRGTVILPAGSGERDIPMAVLQTAEKVVAEGGHVIKDRHGRDDAEDIPQSTAAATDSTASTVELAQVAAETTERKKRGRPSKADLEARFEKAAVEAATVVNINKQSGKAVQPGPTDGATSTGSERDERTAASEPSVDGGAEPATSSEDRPPQSTSTTSSAASKPATTTTPATDDGGLTDEQIKLLRGFSKAMFRAESPESLNKIGIQYWDADDRGGWPPRDRTLQDAAKTVYSTHKGRFVARGPDSQMLTVEQVEADVIELLGAE